MKNNFYLLNKFTLVSIHSKEAVFFGKFYVCTTYSSNHSFNKCIKKMGSGVSLPFSPYLCLPTSFTVTAEKRNLLLRREIRRNGQVRKV